MSLYPPIVEPMMPAFVGNTATISFENFSVWGLRYSRQFI